MVGGPIGRISKYGIPFLVYRATRGLAFGSDELFVSAKTTTPAVE